MSNPYLHKYFKITIKITLISIFAIVLAGSIVRTTGSGMGCPDWPKCFGYLIPPINKSQVLWNKNKSYKQGEMILKENLLWIAKVDFSTSLYFNKKNWQKYTKHNYAKFNVYHTWTEYINRLTSAFSGIPVFFLMMLSLFHIKKNKILVLLSLAVFLMFGFEAWLGKVVVEGNLIPYHITLHMLGALIIIALLIILLNRTCENSKKIMVYKSIKITLWVLLSLSIFQLLLGTSVRENVDNLISDGVFRKNISSLLPHNYLIHRSFSLVLLTISLLLFYLFKKNKLKITIIMPIMILLFLEIIVGIILSYLDFPKFAQSLHLIISFLWLSFQIQLLSIIKIK